METDKTPQVGESLADFAERAGLKVDDATTKKWENPTNEQIKALIKDENEPMAVRLFWRQKLYGRRGGGRKACQQEELQRKVKPTEGRHINPARNLMRGVSGRQRKRAVRLLRRMDSSKALDF